MLNTKTRVAAAGVLAALAALATAAAAAAGTVTPPGAVAPPGMTVQPIATGPGDQLDPHVSGNVVSYTNFDNPTAEIRWHDLGTGADNAIPNGGAYDIVSDVFAGTVVYTHIAGACQDIYSFDTATSGPPTQLDGPTCGLFTDAAIGGNTVVWEDYTVTHSVAQIDVYDRGTGAVTALTQPGTLGVNPSVSPDGATVAWTACDSSGVGCHIWDATRDASGTWTTRQLTNDTGNDELPDTNGTIVVYDCFRGGVQYVCWQPVGGGTETQLGSALSESRNANVSGNVITFEHRDDSAANPNWDVYAYDLSTGALYLIASTPNDEILNDVWSDASTGATHVVWAAQEQTNGYNVYEASFTLPPPDAPLTITAIRAAADRRGDAAAGVTFTDADANGTLSQYTATIDWGDGSAPTAALVATNPLGGFAAGGVHHYAAGGTYTVTVTLHDVGGASATKTTPLVLGR